MGQGDLAAVRDIRRGLRELLASSPHADTADVAELLTSELVTNALIHTDRGAVVTAVVRESGLRVEVKDFVAELPTPYRPTTGDGTHGRGLLLVEALADSWGVREHDRGKIVWFELDGAAPPRC
ncbi:ATP-binding protein [Streptomyces sp. NBC_00083]|uniref:ATP-binding protein n=1 Tax=Streptomyces sp. NBC_00083 TaxID=2975647 RepID=UPI002B1D8126|nr:ATP-binding protein [Streptomyces sp. NBC_00083]